MGGNGGHCSLSLVSSSFLEESDRSPGLSSPIHNEDRSSEPTSSAYAEKRIVFGIPIHLLKGGIPVDDAPLPPVGNVTAILGFKVNLVKEVKKDRDGIRKELKKCKRRSRKYGDEANTHFSTPWRKILDAEATYSSF
ncbi:hypothetical protein LR48_Vigan475s001100 [Vigna angularis]|uniref:Uncharacterized protein n=1 Tax=Phaseolus angularis TaxID=3914 RepID=A0A0L9TCV3_PHAAN|nr:hypothetical protein LR48_Vigan475s001100 [Vigna angularis]